MTAPPAVVGCKVRALFRDGSGEMHLDWPVARIPEAIDDDKGTLWVDIEDPLGKPTPDAERLLREVFRFHPLAVDDALRESHVPNSTIGATTSTSSSTPPASSRSRSTFRCTNWTSSWGPTTSSPTIRSR